MVIKNVKIENFKGISELEFNPKKINILVGKNNTGKTSILEAIDLLFNSNDISRKHMYSYFNIFAKNKTCVISALVDKKKKEITIRESQLSESRTQLAKDVVELFLNNLKRFSKRSGSFNASESIKKDILNIFINNLDDTIQEKLSKNSLTLINEKDEHITYYYIDLDSRKMLESVMDKVSKSLKKLISEDKKTTEKHKQLTRYFDFAAIDTIHSLNWQLRISEENIPTSNVYFTTSIIENFKESFQRRSPKDSEKLYEIEKTIKDHKLIRNLENIDFDNVLFSTKQGIKGHTLDFLGDGIKCIISFLWLLSSRQKNSVILFDEPEEHLHPGYILELVKIMIKFSKELNIQFIMTTHNSDLIDTFLSEDLDENDKNFLKKEFSILRIDKIKNSTIAEYLEYDKCLETKEDLLLDLRGV